MYYVLLDRICAKALVDGAISIQIEASLDREMPAAALITLKNLARVSQSSSEATEGTCLEHAKSVNPPVLIARGLTET